MKKYQIIAALLATILTMRSGVNVFEGHKETYYNLPMRKICERAANNGLIADYSESEDGLKMYGPFVIVAADWNVHPYGSIVNTSRGIGIVLDTGEFTTADNQIIDIKGVEGDWPYGFNYFEDALSLIDDDYSKLRVI